MSTLAALLRYLEREDIADVCLQTDTVVAATRGSEYLPLNKVPLSTSQIEHLLQGTPVLGLLQAQGPSFTGQIDMAVSERNYVVHVQRREGRVQVRFLRAAASPTGVGAVLSAAPAAAPSSAMPAPSVLTPAAVAIGGSKTVAATPRDVALQAQLIGFLLAARKQHASDLHLFAGSPLRVRRYGELIPQGDPLPADVVERMLLNLLEPSQKQMLHTQGYVDFSVDLPQAGRLRVNVGRQSSGLKGCFRLLLDHIPTLQGLGLPQDIANVSHNHQGLAVISGPNGQGKTTTMAAIVDLINTASPHHIITVEDPVEFVHPVKKALISQREVGVHTRSFARALKAALREDPDVIVIGELRDRDTVEIALAAAETGHLVLATMSTRSAAKTIDRLIDLFPPDLQSQVRATLAGALKSVISQRLVPRADGNGMVAAAELMTGSVPLWNLIRDNKLVQLPTLQQRGRSLGMIRFDTSLQELVQAGTISEETAKRQADHPIELERALRAEAANATPAEKTTPR